MNINLTLFGQMIAFALFVWLCMRWVWPPLQAVFEERRARIAQGLEDASKAAEERALAAAQSAEQLEQTRQQVAQMTEAANRRADALVEEARREAETVLTTARERAGEEVGRQTEAARTALAAEMAGLVTATATRALKDALSDDDRRKVLAGLAERLS